MCKGCAEVCLVGVREVSLKGVRGGCLKGVRGCVRRCVWWVRVSLDGGGCEELHRDVETT